MIRKRCSSAMKSYFVCPMGIKVYVFGNLNKKLLRNCLKRLVKFEIFVHGMGLHDCIKSRWLVFCFHKKQFKNEWRNSWTLHATFIWGFIGWRFVFQQAIKWLQDKALELNLSKLDQNFVGNYEKMTSIIFTKRQIFCQ